jgi:hypothetical protein
MAVDVCSEISSTGISPRISFSYDLKQNQTDVLPIEDHHHQRSDLTLLDSSSDFVFCIGNSFVQELSPADELFSNGKIRAKEIKKKVTTPDENEINPSPSESISSSSHSQPSFCTGINTEKKKQLKEFLSNSFDMEDQKPASKSFWQFKRSSSLNCDSARSRSLIRSLQFLSRSNSTGSSSLNSKQTTMNSAKETQKPHLQKQPSVSSRKSSASSSASSSSSCSSTYYYSYSSSQRPSLKKNCGSSYYGNGVRISPVLNIPQPYISKVTVSFFGFGSLFCNGKVKNKKK